MTEAYIFPDEDPQIAYNRVWFNLQRIQRSAFPRIARALKREGIDDPIWYEILIEVERGGADGLPMVELERRLFLPQYALSRHVARITAAGHVRSEAMAGKGRARRLFLTAQGEGLHEKIWPAYHTAIQAEIAARMTTDEAYALSRLLIRLYP